MHQTLRLITLLALSLTLYGCSHNPITNTSPDQTTRDPNAAILDTDSGVWSNITTNTGGYTIKREQTNPDRFLTYDGKQQPIPGINGQSFGVSGQVGYELYLLEGSMGLTADSLNTYLDEYDCMLTGSVTSYTVTPKSDKKPIVNEGGVPVGCPFEYWVLREADSIISFEYDPTPYGIDYTKPITIHSITKNK